MPGGSDVAGRAAPRRILRVSPTLLCCRSVSGGSGGLAASRWRTAILLLRPVGLMIFGVVMALFGALWTLQGLDVFGQEGGMNGQGEWTLIGVVTLVLGLAIAVVGYRGRSRA